MIFVFNYLMEEKKKQFLLLNMVFKGASKQSYVIEIYNRKAQFLNIQIIYCLWVLITLDKYN